MYTRNRNGFCLTNLIQESYLYLFIFQIRILHQCADESLWNMIFKGAQHGDSMADDAIVAARNIIMTSRGLNTNCEVTQCMNGLLIWIIQLECPQGDTQT